MPTEFNDQIKQFAARVEQIHSSIQTEEATRVSHDYPILSSSLGMTFSIPVNSALNLLLMSASKKEKRLIMPVYANMTSRLSLWNVNGAEKH